MALPRVPRLGYKETSQEGWVQPTVRNPVTMPWPKPGTVPFPGNPYQP